MITNQLGRRNLTPDQRRIIVGRRYLREKKRVGEHEGNQYTKMETDQNDHIPTSQKIATETGVSSPTVRRMAKDAEVYQEIQESDPEIKEKLSTGEVVIENVVEEDEAWHQFEADHQGEKAEVCELS